LACVLEETKEFRASHINRCVNSLVIAKFYFLWKTRKGGRRRRRAPWSWMLMDLSVDSSSEASIAGNLCRPLLGFTRKVRAASAKAVFGVSDGGVRPAIRQRWSPKRYKSDLRVELRSDNLCSQAAPAAHGGSFCDKRSERMKGWTLCLFCKLNLNLWNTSNWKVIKI